MGSMNGNRRGWMLAAVAAAGALVSGCAPLVVGGAMAGGALVATDRRSVGIQLEDEAIERRVNAALRQHFKDERSAINVKSYNRRVLLVGEVPTEADKDLAGRTAAAQENVYKVENELYVGTPLTFANRNHDLAVATRVRTALMSDNVVPTNAISITTRRSVVYLMGRVGEAEGARAAEIASREEGVRQVVKLFDYLSEAEWQEIQRQLAPLPAESQRK